MNQLLPLNYVQQVNLMRSDLGAVIQDALTHAGLHLAASLQFFTSASRIEIRGPGEAEEIKTVSLRRWKETIAGMKVTEKGQTTHHAFIDSQWVDI